MIGDKEIQLFVQPNDNINGSRFLDFRVGDGVDFSNTVYTSNLFAPVADAPIIRTRKTRNSGRHA